VNEKRPTSRGELEEDEEGDGRSPDEDDERDSPARRSDEAQG
jgi:hypothetical protein